MCFRDVLSREYSTVLHCLTMPLLSHEPMLSKTVLQTLRSRGFVF